jgi:hypothetical protein
LLAKGDSRNFVMEWPVLLLYLMAMTSLATAAALQLLEGASRASTRLTTAATCPAKRGPANRAQNLHSHTLKGRLGPKSTVFSAFRLDSVLFNWLSLHSRTYTPPAG